MSILADANLPFTVALGLMLLMALVQLIGLGDALGGDVDPGAGLGIDADPSAAVGVGGALATLLGLGRVPLFVWLVLLLFFFAGIGFGIQGLADSLLGAPLDPLPASVLALLAALPVTASTVRPLARMLPQDETTAVSLDSLVGRRAVIANGRAARGSPARARVRDRHGHAHHVMVEPHEDASEIHEGDEVLLLRRDGQTFYASAVSERRLSPAP